MKYSNRPIYIFLLILGCGSGADTGISDITPPLSDAATLVNTFGSEEDTTDTEYLLVRPSGLAVNIRDEVLVVDENWVKVYDANGNPSTRFGGTGQGPGEFQYAVWILLSPDDRIAVNGSLKAHYFRPDFSFINSTYLLANPPFMSIINDLNLSLQNLDIVYSLGENERLYAVNARAPDSGIQSPEKIILIYESADTLTALAEYVHTNTVATEKLRRTLRGLGNFSLGMLPGNRIVYLHSYHDSEIVNNVTAYSLTVQSLDDFHKTYISHSYAPTEIEWEAQRFPEELKAQYPEEFARAHELDEITRKAVAERKFNAPISRLITDDKYIFAFTFLKNKKGETLIDIFDADAGSHIASAYLPAFWIIRNGYGYLINDYQNTNDFPKVEKYKIAPAVYGK